MPELLPMAKQIGDKKIINIFSTRNFDLNLKAPWDNFRELEKYIAAENGSVKAYVARSSRLEIIQIIELYALLLNTVRVAKRITRKEAAIQITNTDLPRELLTDLKTANCTAAEITTNGTGG